MNADDQATAHEEMMRAAALKYRKPELPKIGTCYECGKAVKPNANFCGVDCRATYERRAANIKVK